MWEKEIGVLPVSWPDQADEWAFHLARVLHGPDHWVHGLAGEGSLFGREVVFNPPHDSSMHCSLRVRPAPGGIACVVFDEEGPGSETDAQRWQDAAESPVAQMGRSNQDFDWSAVLGPHPSAPEWLRFAPLAQPTVLGPVQLAPGGVRMREMAGYSRGQIESPWPARYTWPVIATGAVRTYRPEFAEHLARKLTYRICALLSVISGTCWIARSGPHVQIPGFPERGLRTVPQSIGSWENTPHPDESLPADFNVYEGDEPFVLPPWTPRAWDLMDEDETVKRAVHGCYEALSLEMEHPSAAFVIYVATIEGIGARLADLESCKQCGSRIGAGRRFREALKTVLPADEAKALGGLAYSVRSKTGHEGQLFGGEDTLGYSNFSLFQFDDADVFDYGLIWPMRKACRELIGNLLCGAPRGEQANY